MTFYSTSCVTFFVKTMIYLTSYCNWISSCCKVHIIFSLCTYWVYKRILIYTIFHGASFNYISTKLWRGYIFNATSNDISLMKGQGHTSRSRVTDMEVFVFSKCFLVFYYYYKNRSAEPEPFDLDLWPWPFDKVTVNSLLHFCTCIPNMKLVSQISSEI